MGTLDQERAVPASGSRGEFLTLFSGPFGLEQGEEFPIGIEGQRWHIVKGKEADANMKKAGRTGGEAGADRHVGKCSAAGPVRTRA